MKNLRFKELFRRYEGNPIITVKDIPYTASSVFNAGAASLSELPAWLKKHNSHSGKNHHTLSKLSPVACKKLLQHYIRKTTSCHIFYF